jgi:D-threo-aldose 1-dehydrogenase
MRTKILGRTGLEVPIIGIGTAFLGYNGTDAWVDTGTFEPDREAGVAALLTVLKHGATLIDTSPMYGRSHVEEIVGEALRQRPDRNSPVTVMTKVGRQWDHQDYSRDGVRASVLASAERLGVDKIDIVSIHDAIGRFDEVMGKGGALEALRELQDEGVVGFVGTATMLPDANAEFMETGEFDVAVVAGAWSLINQEMLKRVAPAAEKYDMGLLAATPLERGLLVDGLADAPGRPNNRLFSPETVEQVGKIKAISESYGIPLFAVALQWLTRHPRVGSAIPGARVESEAEANANAGELEIPDALWEEIAPLIRHWDIGRK